MSAVAVGVDIGGTKTAAALVGADGSLGRVASVPTPAASGGEPVLDAVARLVRDVADGQPLVGVGVGTAGVVDATLGRIVSATDTFAAWVGTDVAAGLRARLGVDRVEVRNDVDAHALGEAWRGAGAGAASVLMVAVGTGVGGALVLDGRLRTGARHVAGELAHVPAVGAEGLRCPCGRLGHLEALAAGPAIARRYHALTRGDDRPDTCEVAQRAASGDEHAVHAITDAAACLGRTVAGIVTVIDPDVVIVGGGVPGIGPLWWDTFEASCRAELIDVLADVPLVGARLGPQAALLGAARTVLQRDKE